MEGAEHTQDEQQLAGAGEATTSEQRHKSLDKQDSALLHNIKTKGQNAVS